MKHLLLLLLPLAWLAGACTVVDKLKRKYFVYVSETDLRKNGGFPSRAVVFPLVIDNTFQLYVRTVCRVKPPQGFYRRGRPTVPASVERCDCANLPDSATREKLEIQYLLISRQQNQFIYISSLPPYIVKGRSHFDSPLSQLDHFVNLSEMNTFFFGELLANTGNPAQVRVELWRHGAERTSFGAALGREQWLFTLDERDTRLTLDRVEQEQAGSIVATEPARIFSHSLRFYRPQTPWVIGLSRHFEAATIAQAAVAELVGGTFYVVHRNNEIEQVAVRFNPSYTYGSDPDDVAHGLYFRGNRVKAHPLFRPRDATQRPMEPKL